MSVAQTPVAHPPLRVAFATPALRRCQATLATARIVDMATLVAVSVYVFGRSGAAAVAVFGVVRTMVPALLTPLVTSAAGRRSPERGLQICVVAAALGSAATAVLVASDGPLLGIYAAAGATGVVLYCMRPLVSALLPNHINGPRELMATNAAVALVDNLSTVIGPLMAAAAAATVGPATALWLSAGLLGICAFLVSGIPASPVWVGVPASTLARETVEGFVCLAESGHVRLVVGLPAVQTFVRGALNVLVVALAIDTLEMGDGGVGLLLGAIGVGGLVGFPVAVRIVRRIGMAAALGLAMVLWGAPIAFVSIAHDPAVVLVLFALVGVGNDLVDISVDTLLQRLIPHGALARALGAFDAVLFAGMALGAVAGERLLRTWGLRPALLVLGMLLPLVAVVTWRHLRRLDRDVRDRDADVALLQVDGILSPLVMSTVDHLVRGMALEEFAAGETIIGKGDLGDRYLLIEHGEVEIVDDGALVAVLGPGDGFGEIALLEEVPRNASAVARSAVVLRSLHRDDFLGAVRSHDRAHQAAQLRVHERRRGPLIARDHSLVVGPSGPSSPRTNPRSP